MLIAQPKSVAQNYMYTKFNGETLIKSQLILNEANLQISCYKELTQKSVH
jgi:hypothetical protein